MKQVLVAAVLIFAGYLVYNHFRAPNFPGLQTMIGDIRAAKEDCVGMASSVKRAQAAGGVTDRQLLHQAVDHYRQTSAAFNGCSAAISAGLDSSFDSRAPQDIQARLNHAASRYESFRNWYRGTWPMHTTGMYSTTSDPLSTLKQIVDSLGPGVARLYDDFMKKSDYERAQLKIALLAGQFPSWEQVPTH